MASASFRQGRNPDRERNAAFAGVEIAALAVCIEPHAVKILEMDLHHPAIVPEPTRIQRVTRLVVDREKQRAATPRAPLSYSRGMHELQKPSASGF